MNEWTVIPCDLSLVAKWHWPSKRPAWRRFYMADTLSECRHSQNHAWQGVPRHQWWLPARGRIQRWHWLELGCVADHATTVSLCCCGYCQCIVAVGYLLLIRFTSVDFCSRGTAVPDMKFFVVTSMEPVPWVCYSFVDGAPSHIGEHVYAGNTFKPGEMCLMTVSPTHFTNSLTKTSISMTYWCTTWFTDWFKTQWFADWITDLLLWFSDPMTCSFSD